MLAKLPVLAANTGGPVETIVDSETGWLRDPDDVQAWKEVMAKALSMSEAEVAQVGDKGRTRVRKLFGREEMAKNLDGTVDEIMAMPVAGGRGLNVIFRLLNIVVFFAIGMGAALLFSKDESKEV